MVVYNWKCLHMIWLKMAAYVSIWLHHMDVYFSYATIHKCYTYSVMNRIANYENVCNYFAHYYNYTKMLAFERFIADGRF